MVLSNVNPRKLFLFEKIVLFHFIQPILNRFHAANAVLRYTAAKSDVVFATERFPVARLLAGVVTHPFVGLWRKGAIFREEQFLGNLHHLLNERIIISDDLRLVRW